MHRAPSQKYRPFPPIDLPDRRWPSATLTRPLERDHGLALPRLLQIEFSQVVQATLKAVVAALDRALAQGAVRIGAPHRAAAA